jgi:hypothetical protein
LTGLALAQPSAAGPTRFDRRKFFSVGDTTTAEFLSLFHRYGYIYKPFSGDSWLSADERWKLTDSEILKAAACQHKQYLLGARSGKTTRFAVLDIDAGSQYHNQRDLNRLINHLMAVGLAEPVLYRSSYSEGWHLYMFFEQPVPSKEIHKLLTQHLRNAGFTIRPGTLEVFPNPGDRGLGYGLRLPLQPGWAWLDPNTLETTCERDILEPATALNKFVADLEDFANEPAAYEQFKTSVQQMASAQREIADRVERAIGKTSSHIHIANELAMAAIERVFQTPPPGIIADVWWRGRGYFESGLTGPSQRADAIFSLGHYLFYGDPEKLLEPLGYNYEEERRYAIESILAAKSHGHSRDLDRNRADATKQIGRCAHWLPANRKDKETKPYKKVVPISWARHNGKLKADAISRIKGAMDELVAAAVRFKVADLEQLAGCSRSTLYAHKAIWYALYQELKQLPQKSSDEYNAVVGAAGLESGSPASVCAMDMPPGRLAARRVALQLSEKIENDKQKKQKYIEAISDRYLLSWKAKVLAALPPDLAAADVRQLKTCAPILLALVAGAPDEEHQIWLQEQLQIIRRRLDELRQSWSQSQLRLVDPSD